MVNVSVTTVGAICEDRFHRAQGRDFCNMGPLCDSTGPHRSMLGRLSARQTSLNSAFAIASELRLAANRVHV